MLSQEKNDQLTQVGPDTPMGDLLRRYWMPIAAATEFDEKAVRAVRLMGEDLVLYKDLGGRYGLIDRQCPHRRADLSYAFVEQCGLRCNYHGWLFDETGQCIEQPYDDVATPELNLKEKVKIKSYPVQEKGGLLWAYMGPLPAPLLPNYEPFGWTNGFKQIVFANIPCNWFQCQENSIDPVHFEWMHANWSVRLRNQTGPYAARHLKVGFDEFDHGFVYKRVREDTDEEHDLWKVGRVCLWPNGVFLGDHFEWRVPIDDENTLSVCWSFSRVPHESEPYEQEKVPYWYGPIKDEQGRWLSTHVMNQDFVAWVGQGVVADRRLENLTGSDRGVLMIRRQFFQDMEKIKRGEDPKAIVRDPAKNISIELPIVNRANYTQGMAKADLLKHPILGHHLHGYAFQAGQPQEIADAYTAAMGITPEDLKQVHVPLQFPTRGGAGAS